MTTENILALLAVLPGVYAVVCWIRRVIHAEKAAKWVREHFSAEWDSLHWLAKRNAWAGVEVLISKGLISGPEVAEFAARDEKLQRATWVGLFVAASLLLLVVILKLATEMGA